MKSKIKAKLNVRRICFVFLSLIIPISFTKASENQNTFKNDLHLINNTNLNNPQNNLPIKSEYILGVGDILTIEFKGLEIFNSSYPIDPEGEINLPELNKVKVNNLTLGELKQKLENQYEEFIINPEIEITINDYRPVTFYISGEVKNPGLYTLDNQSNVINNFKQPSFTDQYISSSYRNTINVPKLFDAIKLSRGVNNTADLSKVKIIRNNSLSQGGGKIQTEVNFLDLILNGNQSQNVRLFDGDVIKIPRTEKIIKNQILAINKSNLSPNEILVYITGNVKKPGNAVLPRGASLIQSIASTGGKKLMTGYIDFIRFNDDGSTLKRTFRYDQNAQINTYKNPVLTDGDIINVRKTILGNTTEIINEISSPVLGGYGLFKIFD